MNFQGIIVEKNYSSRKSAILFVSEDCDDTDDNNKPYLQDQVQAVLQVKAVHNCIF